MFFRRNQPAPVQRDNGPRRWLFEQRKATYAKLMRRGEEENPAALANALEADVINVDENIWTDRLAEYKRRKTSVLPPAAGAALEAMPSPIVPGARNWSPLGPTVLNNGQAVGNPAVGGRVVGIAPMGDGLRVYAASANGGVFRSDDGGIAWRSLMDAFDVDPTNFASTSLACGAIAVDPDHPDRIYVGTGEGDTHGMFDDRIVHALPAHRGIGPIRSDDGGTTWVLENSAAGSANLAGKAFYALAIDPTNHEHVIAATTEGLYERVIAANGTPEWVRRRPGIHTSVIATAGAPHFYAAEAGVGVFKSADGRTWSAIATGFPTAHVGRIALAAKRSAAKFVYAFVAQPKPIGTLNAVCRFDIATSKWSLLTNVPNVLSANQGRSQGDYDLAIAVDPDDENIIYLGGNSLTTSPFPASIWRCVVAANGSITATSIGKEAHADVHVLTHTPGDSNALWTGCDGGVFLNRNPRGNGVFASRNNGLSCLCSNFVAQHPTDPSILFCGLQDNGTARTHGSPAWEHVMGGDGGYCAVNWADPQQVLVSMNGQILRSSDGGTTWREKVFDFFLMTYPLATLPRNPAKPAEAKIVAAAVVEVVNHAAVASIFLSTDFGSPNSWKRILQIPGIEIYSLAFATPDRLFAGATDGSKVFRVDRVNATTWKSTRIDNVAAGPIGVIGPISDVAVDPAVPQRNAIYVALGGTGDFRHVWRFDGTRWEARSGAAGADNLIDVEHNALAIDANAPQNLYAGADIGVWQSADSGMTWTPLSNGLPDAPVFDLQIHPTRNLLRAATHGRGIYEITL